MYLPYRLHNAGTRTRALQAAVFSKYYDHVLAIRHQLLASPSSLIACSAMSSMTPVSSNTVLAMLCEAMSV